MSNKAEYRQLASSTRRGNKTTLNARGTHIIIPETQWGNPCNICYVCCSESHTQPRRTHIKCKCESKLFLNRLC